MLCHGMHLPAAMDGGPHHVIEPGQTWSPTWLIDQPAATLWYHPHTHGLTELHVGRGLAGLFILDDDESAELDIPAEYGVDDIQVIVQDRSFDDQRSEERRVGKEGRRQWSGEYGRAEKWRRI